MRSSPLDFFVLVTTFAAIILVIGLLRLVTRAIARRHAPSREWARFMFLVAGVTGLIELVGLIWVFGAPESLLSDDQPVKDDTGARALVAIALGLAVVFAVAMLAMVLVAALEFRHARPLRLPSPPRSLFSLRGLLFSLALLTASLIPYAAGQIARAQALKVVLYVLLAMTMAAAVALYPRPPRTRG